jgi:sec-independent protein translocase protein TatB
MFDVGFAEILLLSLVGLLVLGPERLPRVARTLGGLARKARSSWLNLKRSIEAEVRAEELKEPLQRFQNEIKSGVADVRRGVDSVVKPYTDSAESDNPDTDKPEPPARHGESDERS